MDKLKTAILRFFAEYYNPATLRLFMGSTAEADFRDALRWEKEHN